MSGRHIVLVGLMGSGKTSVGRMVASRLGWGINDSDEEILRTTGRTVAKLKAEIGTDAMHELEAAQLVFALGKPEPSVICAAASVVENGRCRSVLMSPGVAAVWLRASTETLAVRFRSAEHRPDFGDDPRTFLDEQSTVRAPLFESVSRLVIDVDDRSVVDICDQIVSTLVHNRDPV